MGEWYRSDSVVCGLAGIRGVIRGKLIAILPEDFKTLIQQIQESTGYGNMFLTANV
jgi:hypothetical protein